MNEEEYQIHPVEDSEFDGTLDPSIDVALRLQHLLFHFLNQRLLVVVGKSTQEMRSLIEIALVPGDSLGSFGRLQRGSQRVVAAVEPGAIMRDFWLPTFHVIMLILCGPVVGLVAQAD